MAGGGQGAVAVAVGFDDEDDLALLAGCGGGDYVVVVEEGGEVDSVDGSIGIGRSGIGGGRAGRRTVVDADADADAGWALREGGKTVRWGLLRRPEVGGRSLRAGKGRDLHLSLWCLV